MCTRWRQSHFCCCFVCIGLYFNQYLVTSCTSACQFSFSFFDLVFLDMSRQEYEMQVVNDGLFMFFVIFQKLRYCSTPNFLCFRDV